MASDPFPSLDEALHAVRNLPPLPGVAALVLASLGDERLDGELLARRIASDTALAARTLRVANSPYYGLQGRIDSIQEAVVVIGFSNLRSLAMASALTLAFGEGAHRLDHRAFWRHSLGTAAAASATGGVLGGNSGLLFLAGLMHDMGRLALGVTFPDAFQAVVRRREQDDSDWVAAETAVLGYDHAVLGGALCEHWRFPVAITRAVASHHKPGDDGDRLCDMLHVADVVARALELAGDASAVPRIAPAAWNRLAIDDDALRRILVETERQFEALLQVLG